MDNFKPILKEINSKLDLPQPTKSRIILEIAADLNDTFDTYKKQGLMLRQFTEQMTFLRQFLLSGIPCPLSPFSQV